jgi:uncharacterized protein YaaR (DUF327 family)
MVLPGMGTKTMAKVDFSDTSLFLNPASYVNARGELKKKDPVLEKKLREQGKIRQTPKAPFFDILEDAVRETGELPEQPASEKVLQELLDDVHSAGDELKNRPLPEEIKRYKQAVRNFIHYVVENGYAIKEQTTGSNLIKRKKYVIVQVVDKKLEQLAAGILAGQINQLELLSRTDEIAGLLVDLLQ